MKQNTRSPEPDRQYIEITCRNGKITERLLTYDEMQALDPADDDFFVNKATGEIRIQPQEGEPLEHEDGIPGVGKNGWVLLDLLMWVLEYQTVDELYRRSNNDSFAGKENVQALMTRLRRAFGESGDKPWFFRTRKNGKYAIRWDRKRSWRIIEKRALPPSTPKQDS